MTQQQNPKSTKKHCSEIEPPSFVQLREQSSSLQKFWNWTGFKEKKLWDVLQLLIVPTALALGAFYLQETAKQRDLRIADDRAKQETLNRYFDQISTLLLDQKLRTSQKGDEVITLARTRTLTALRDLDGERKGSLIRFLHEANLIQGEQATIKLLDADLRKINLSGAILQAANLNGANLSGANLSKADLRADLSEADLQGADLRESILFAAVSFVDRKNGERLYPSANLRQTNLSKADLRGTILNISGSSISPDLRVLQDAYLCKTTMPDGTKSDRDCEKLKQHKYRQRFPSLSIAGTEKP